MATKVQESLIQRLEFALSRNDLSDVELYAERMVQDYPDCWLGHFALGYCAYWNYDLDRALDYYAHAASCPGQAETPLRGLAWLLHGQLYDLLGMRDRAIECYKNALQLPDFEGQRGYHAHARRYLETPFTWQERFRLLAHSVRNAAT